MQIIETKDNFTIIGNVECDACHGTGLYQGFAERDGAFVVCYRCNGKGCIEIKEIFHKFFTRKIEKRCKRVYSKGCSIVITDKDIITPDKRYISFSKYGCSYEDWLKGAKPIPLKFADCPYLETNQALQSKDKNKLYKNRCSKGTSIGESIYECKFFKDKEKCWEIYERE